MKNKGLVIFLMAVGAIAIISTIAYAGYFWWRGDFGRCSAGNRQWNFSPRMGGGMMRGGGLFTKNPPISSTLSLEEARAAIDEYLNEYDSDGNFQIDEIMIFDNHAYAEVVEEESGIGAFEVLVDPYSMAVHPEMGPNMIWNLKYGHMNGGMMGSSFAHSGVNMPVSEDEAVHIADEYLRVNRSELRADDHPDPFYGYYTIHTIKDGKVFGMLSVNGYDGKVFMHTWHGNFIEMTEHENDTHSD